VTASAEPLPKNGFPTLKVPNTLQRDAASVRFELSEGHLLYPNIAIHVADDHVRVIAARNPSVHFFESHGTNIGTTKNRPRDWRDCRVMPGNFRILCHVSCSMVFHGPGTLNSRKSATKPPELSEICKNPEKQGVFRVPWNIFIFQIEEGRVIESNNNFFSKQCVDIFWKMGKFFIYENTCFFWIFFDFR